MARWHLEAIDLTGGFLGGLSLRLPPRLVCVIGPRGSGKSTLAEAIRCTLAGTTGAPKARLDLVRANLASAVVTLGTSGENGQARYMVRRTVGQPAALSTPDGRPLSSVDIDRGTFLPIDAYTSAEIEAIADESLGERRRALLDDLRPDDMQKLVVRVGEFRRALEANADAIALAAGTVSDLGERIEEFGDARARAAALPALGADADATDLVAASTQDRVNQRELEHLTAARAALGELRGVLGDLVERAASSVELVTVGGSANTDITEAMDAQLATCIQVVSRHVANAIQTLQEGVAALAAAEPALLSAHSKQADHYLRIQQLHQQAAVAVRARADAEQAVAALVSLEAKRVKAKGDLERLKHERKDLRAKFLLERDKISELRETVATGLAKDVGQNVRIRVLRNADSLGYQERLLSGLKGARVKNHDEILRALLRLRPEQLAQVIADDDLAELEQQTSLGGERGGRILASFKAVINPLELEVQPIDDRVSIELNVASKAEPLYRDASELSRGQKCTAMLPLLLARRDTPLVIDQPEDNLDNHFIYETVVESIRRLKAWRQMIFITHNANIPVLGEADLVVVLNSDGKRGFVEKAGTFEECRNEIIDLLEGGREAFELRSRRYGAR